MSAIWTIEVGGTSRKYKNAKFERALKKDMPTSFEAQIQYASPAVDFFDLVEIKRNGTTEWKGFIETISIIWSEDGRYYNVAGRSTSLILWKKFNEEFTSYAEGIEGFFGSVNASELIKFLLRTPRSDLPSENPDYKYNKMGWGLDASRITELIASQTSYGDPNWTILRKRSVAGWRNTGTPYASTTKTVVLANMDLGYWLHNGSAPYLHDDDTTNYIYSSGMWMDAEAKFQFDDLAGATGINSVHLAVKWFPDQTWLWWIGSETWVYVSRDAGANWTFAGSFGGRTYGFATPTYRFFYYDLGDFFNKVEYLTGGNARIKFVCKSINLANRITNAYLAINYSSGGTQDATDYFVASFNKEDIVGVYFESRADEESYPRHYEIVSLSDTLESWETGWAETDPNSHITLADSYRTIQFDSYQNEDAHYSKDFGTDGINAFDYKFAFKITGTPEDHSYCFIPFVVSQTLDDLNHIKTGATYYITFYIACVSEVLQAWIEHGGGGSSHADACLAISIGTTYYVRVVRSGTMVKCMGYSDPSLSDLYLLWTKTNTLASATTKYRYRIQACTFNGEEQGSEAVDDDYDVDGYAFESSADFDFEKVGASPYLQEGDGEKIYAPCYKGTGTPTDYGYSILGTAGSLNIEDTIQGDLITAITGGEGQSITVGLKWLTAAWTGKIKCGIYLHSDLSLKGVTEERTIALTDTATFYTFNFTGSPFPKPILITGTVYVLVVWAEQIPDTNAMVVWDNGSTDECHTQSLTYNGFPNPYVPSAHNNYKLSIYITVAFGAPYYADEYSWTFPNLPEYFETFTATNLVLTLRGQLYSGSGGHCSQMSIEAQLWIDDAWESIGEVSFTDTGYVDLDFGDYSSLITTVAIFNGLKLRLMVSQIADGELDKGGIELSFAHLHVHGTGYWYPVTHTVGEIYAFYPEEIVLVADTTNTYRDVIHSWSPQNIGNIRIKITDADAHAWIITQLYIYKAEDEDYRIMHEDASTPAFPLNQYIHTITIDDAYSPAIGPLNITEGRVIDQINSVLNNLHTAYVPYEWYLEMSATNTFHICDRQGSDKNITFSLGNHLESDTKEDTIEDTSQRIKLKGSGEGANSESVSSGWLENTSAMVTVGTFFENISSEKEVADADVAELIGQIILTEKSPPISQVVADVSKDDNASMDYDVGDTVKITDSLLGLSASVQKIYNIMKKVNENGERITLYCGAPYTSKEQSLKELFNRLKNLELSGGITGGWTNQEKGKMISVTKIDTLFEKTGKEEELTTGNVTDPKWKMSGGGNGQAFDGGDNGVVLYGVTGGSSGYISADYYYNIVVATQQGTTGEDIEYNLAPRQNPKLEFEFNAYEPQSAPITVWRTGDMFEIGLAKHVSYKTGAWYKLLSVSAGLIEVYAVWRDIGDAAETSKFMAIFSTNTRYRFIIAYDYDKKLITWEVWDIKNKAKYPLVAVRSNMDVSDSETVHPLYMKLSSTFEAGFRAISILNHVKIQFERVTEEMGES